MRDFYKIAMDKLVRVEVADNDGLAFICRSPVEPDKALRVIASNGFGWDHVSVSLVDRCPVWEEMEHVRSIVFLPEETAMQLHVPDSDHISHHPNCLHMWRPHALPIPRPPGWMVAPEKLAGKKKNG